MEGDVNGGIASPGAAVMKRGQVVALGQHGEPKENDFYFPSCKTVYLEWMEILCCVLRVL